MQAASAMHMHNAHVPGPRNAWWHPPAPRNACSPSVTAGSGHSKDSQHVFPKRGERLVGHLNLFGLSNWTKRLEADPRGRSICFSSGQSGSLCGNTIDCKHFMGPPPAKILPPLGKNWKSENQVDRTYSSTTTKLTPVYVQFRIY